MSQPDDSTEKRAEYLFPDIKCTPVDTSDYEWKASSLNINNFKLPQESEAYEEFRQISRLVSLINKVKKENIMKFISIIDETCFPYTKKGVKIIFRHIFEAARLFPNKIDILYDFYCKLIDKASPKNYYGRFTYLLAKFQKEISRKSFHLFYLIIYPMLKSNKVNDNYFIKSYSHEINLVKDGGRFIMDMGCLYKTKKNKEILFKDIDLKYQYSELMKAIHDDNEVDLQRMSSDVSFDFNMELDVSYYFAQTCFQIRKLRLIDYAAFCGSIKCFKFLLSNQAELNENPDIDFSICGSNIEIIRICQQNGFKFPNGIQTAISYHRTKIFNWLIENRMVSSKFSDSSIFPVSVRAKFWRGIEYLIQKEENIGVCIEIILSKIYENCDYEGLSFLIKTVPGMERDIFTSQFKNKSDEKYNLRSSSCIVFFAINHISSMFKLCVSRFADYISKKDMMSVYKVLQDNWSHSIVMALFESKIIDKSGEYPNFMSCALKKNDLITASELTNYDVRYFNDPYDLHPLNLAVQENDVEKVKFVLGIPGIEVNSARMNSPPPICSALFNNNEEIIDLLLSREDLCINVRSKYGTPLTIALERCSKKIFEQIYHRKDIDINLEASNGGALFFACKNGNYDLYDLIMSTHGISIDSGIFRSPFIAACGSGSIDIVKDMYEKFEIDLDYESVDGTALYVSCSNNHLEIAKFIVEQGADINKGLNDINPLFVACENNHLDIVRFLLSLEGIDTSFPQPRTEEESGQQDALKLNRGHGLGIGLGFGRGIGSGGLSLGRLRMLGIDSTKEERECKIKHKCLLSNAISTSNKEMIDLIFNRVKDSITQEDAYASLVSACSVNDCEMVELLLSSPQLQIPEHSDLLMKSIIEERNDVVEILLQSSKINVNANYNNMNPIMFAISHSERRLFDNLVKHPKVDLNIQSPENPLQFACKNGNLEFVQALLEIPNTIIKDNGVLQIACMQNNFEMVSLLVKYPNINVNHEQVGTSMNRNRSTPLIVACNKQNESIVQILCDHPSININYAVDKTNPLVITCMNENKRILDILTSHPRIDANARGCSRSPIGIAFSNSNSYFIDRLMSFEDLDFNINDATNPLIMSVKRSNTEWVKKIISSPNLDPNFAIKGFSALSHSCNEGKLEITKLLLQHPQININQPKKNPLKLACKKGHLETVSLLISRPEINFGACKGLFYAAIRSNNIGIVQKLLDSKMIEINQEHKGRTAISSACCIGSFEIVTLLLKQPGIDINAGRVHPLESSASSASLINFNLILSQPSIEFSDCIENVINLIIKRNLLIFAESLFSNQVFIDNVSMFSDKISNCLTNDIDQSLLKLIISLPLKLSSSILRSIFKVCYKTNNISLIKQILQMDPENVVSLIRSDETDTSFLDLLIDLNDKEIFGIIFNCPEVTTLCEGKSPIKLAIRNNCRYLFDKMLNMNQFDVNDGNPLGEALKSRNNHYIDVLINHPDVVLTIDDFVSTCSSVELHKYIPIFLTSTTFDINSNVLAMECLKKIIESNNLHAFHLIMDKLDQKFFKGYDNQSSKQNSVGCKSGLGFPMSASNHLESNCYGTKCVEKAVQIQDEDMIDRLLQVDGIEVSVSSLVMAIKSKNRSIVQKLINFGTFDINTVINRETPLIFAIQSKSVSILKIVLSSPFIDINFYSKDEERFKILKKKSFFKINRDQFSPLSVALIEKNEEAIDLLLGNPSILIEENGFQNIYENAIKSDFIDKIIECRYFDVRRSSLLSFACLINKVDLVERLLAIDGIDINYHHLLFSPPIVSAIKSGNSSIVKRLISLPGIIINFEQASKSPLYFALKLNNIEIINSLLELPGIDKTVLSYIDEAKKKKEQKGSLGLGLGFLDKFKH